MERLQPTMISMATLVAGAQNDPGSVHDIVSDVALRGSSGKVPNA
jgi:hypothetical protein